MLFLAASIAAGTPGQPQATPCPASTAATRASSSALSPMPPDFQLKKRTNSIKTVSSEKQALACWHRLIRGSPQ